MWLRLRHVRPWVAGLGVAVEGPRSIVHVEGNRVLGDLAPVWRQLVVSVRFVLALRVFYTKWWVGNGHVDGLVELRRVELRRVGLRRVGRRLGLRASARLIDRVAEEQSSLL